MSRTVGRTDGVVFALWRTNVASTPCLRTLTYSCSPHEDGHRRSFSSAVTGSGVSIPPTSVIDDDRSYAAGSSQGRPKSASSQFRGSAIPNDDRRS